MARAQMLRIAAACAAIGLAGLPCAADEPTRLPRRNKDGSFLILSSGISRALPLMPSPIRELDFAAWRRIVRLTEDQQALVDDLFAKYQANEPELYWEHVQPLHRRAQLGPDGMAGVTIASATSFAEMVDHDLPEAIARYANYEDRFLSDWRILVNEQQLARIESVIALRRRQRQSTDPSEYPGGHIDVIQILIHSTKSGLQILADDSPEVWAVVGQYDADVTGLFEQRGQAIIENSARGAVISAHRMAGIGNHEELNAESLRIQTQLVSMEKRIHDVNVNALAAFESVLPLTAATELRSAFEALAYPTAYPDATDSAELFRAILELTSLDETQRAAMLAYEAEFRSQRLAVCRRLVDCFLAQREREGIATHASPGEFEAYTAKMAALHQDRLQIARRTMKEVRSLLRPEQLEIVQRPLAAFERNIIAYKMVIDPRRPGFDGKDRKPRGPVERRQG